MAQWMESSFQLGWQELFDDPSMIPSTQQAVELLAADHDHQYEFEFEASVESILCDIERDAALFSVPDPELVLQQPAPMPAPVRLQLPDPTWLLDVQGFMGRRRARKLLNERWPMVYRKRQEVKRSGQ